MSLGKWMVATLAILLLIGAGIARCLSDSRVDTDARGRWRVETFEKTMSGLGHGREYYDHLFVDDRRIAGESDLDSCILEPEFAPRTVVCCEWIPQGAGRRLVAFTAEDGKGKVASRTLGGVWVEGGKPFCQMSKRLTGSDDPHWFEGKFQYVRTLANPGHPVMQDVEFDPATGRTTSAARDVGSPAGEPDSPNDTPSRPTPEPSPE